MISFWLKLATGDNENKLAVKMFTYRVYMMKVLFILNGMHS